MTTCEYLGLDLIMNANKRVKKIDKELAKTNALNKMHKAFQILMNKISANKTVIDNIDDFIAFYNEMVTRDIIEKFERKLISGQYSSDTE